MKTIEFVNGVSIEVVEHEDTWAVSNAEVAMAFGIEESSIRSHKSRGEYKEGIHFYGVANCNTAGGGGSQVTMWTKKGVITLGFKLRETPQTIAFRDWASDYIIAVQKKRLSQLGAVEEEDYLLNKFIEQLPSGAKQKIDYIVTVDIAKHLAMMERNEKGKEVRDYFIRVEKEARRMVEANRVTEDDIKVDVGDPHWRAAFFFAFDGKCYYTGQELRQESFHLDHIVPRSKGGRDDLFNLVVAAPAINSSKGDSVNPVHIERALQEVRDIYAPKVLEYYHRHRHEMVSPELKANSFMANAAFIRELRAMYGNDPVRNLYALLIPGLKVRVKDTITEMTDEDYVIDFCHECLAKEDGGLAKKTETFDAYVSYCDKNGNPPLGRVKFYKIMSNTGYETRKVREVENNSIRQFIFYTDVTLLS